MTTPLGHGQQLCEVIQMQHSSKALWPPHGFWVTLMILPRVKVMAHLWVMDNNCVKYYPDTTVGSYCADLGDMTLVQGHDTLLGHGKLIV